MVLFVVVGIVLVGIFVIFFSKWNGFGYVLSGEKEEEEIKKDVGFV